MAAHFVSRKLGWCRIPSEDTCKGDGLQFHQSSEKRKQGDDKGVISKIYDIERNNRYQITEPGRYTGDIHQYWLYIHVSDDDPTLHSFTVQEKQGVSMAILTTFDHQELPDGEVAEIKAKGDLMQDITVTKETSGGQGCNSRYSIVYAQDSLKDWDQLRVFSFTTDNTGDGHNAGSPFALDDKDKKIRNAVLQSKHRRKPGHHPKSQGQGQGQGQNPRPRSSQVGLRFPWLVMYACWSLM